MQDNTSTAVSRHMKGKSSSKNATSRKLQIPKLSNNGEYENMKQLEGLKTTTSQTSLKSRAAAQANLI